MRIFNNVGFKKLISSFLCIVLIIGIAVSCNVKTPEETQPPVTEQNNYTQEDLSETETPATTCNEPKEQNIPQQQITLDDLKEMNGGKLPEIEYDNGIIRRIEGEISYYPIYNEKDARTLLYNYFDLFGLNEDMDLRIEKIYEFGYHFKQYYKGIKIDGNKVGGGVNVDKESGHATVIGNQYFANLDIETTPQISLEEAKNIIISKYNTTINEEQEVEFFIHYDGNKPDIAPELVWEIYLIGGSPFLVCISAITGEIIYTESNPREPTIN